MNNQNPLVTGNKQTKQLIKSPQTEIMLGKEMLQEQF